MTRAIMALMVSVCVVFTTAAQTRLDEFIKDVPAGETVQIKLSARRPSWDIPTILSNTDAIIEGRVASIRSEATGLPDHVSTRLVIVVNEVWLDKRAILTTPDGALERVVVRQPGGRLAYRERFVEVFVDSFPILPA